METNTGTKMTKTAKQVASDKVVALHQIDGFREWLDRYNLDVCVSNWGGEFTISKTESGYNLVGVINSFFVSSMEPHVLLTLIKHIVEAHNNGMYQGKREGKREAQNAIREALGFDEIERD
jgi:hypothetical protein